MILYLDTSAFVKLFFHESGSETVVDLVNRADSVITSQVAYAESCSALARRKRDKRISQADFKAAKKQLDELWPQMDKAIVDEIKSGELAIKHVIRAFDAIHLAAAVDLRTAVGKMIEVTFCSFDERQNQAARVENLGVIEPVRNDSRS